LYNNTQFLSKSQEIKNQTFEDFYWNRWWYAVFCHEYDKPRRSGFANDHTGILN